MGTRAGAGRVGGGLTREALEQAGEPGEILAVLVLSFLRAADTAAAGQHDVDRLEDPISLASQAAGKKL